MEPKSQVGKLKRQRKFQSWKLVGIHLFLIALLLGLLVPADFFRLPTLFGAVLSQVRILGAFAPTFDYVLQDTIINQTDIYYLDVNCSDSDPLDSITYGDNFTGFSIGSDTGIINVSGFSQSYVGNHTILIYCHDLFEHNTTDEYLLTILDVNEPPVLDSIGDQILTEGEVFVLDLGAADPENDVLVFGESTSLFAIDSQTGLINYTPAFSHIGNHTINFTVFDGEYHDHEVVIFTIVRGQYCGDTLCGRDESCLVCEQDCGACPESPPGESGETSEESEESTTSSNEQTTGEIPPQSALAPQPPQYRCEEKWDCTPWSQCAIQGSHTRKCKDTNHCGSSRDKPKEAEECEYIPTCEDGVQNGGETGIDCGGPCKPCAQETCFDGIQNQGERGIDCEGPCEKPCEIVAQARVPSLEIPGILEIPRVFPWLFLLFIAMLLSIALMSDYAYVRRISRKSLDEYNQKRRAYAPWRRRLYHVLIDLIATSLIISAYLYYFSNEKEALVKYAWALILVIVATHIAAGVIIRKLRYYEYERQRKEKRFRQTHRREILALIRAQNELLKGLEVQGKSGMYDAVKENLFAGYSEIYGSFRMSYGPLVKIIRKRNERLDLLAMTPGQKQKIQTLLSQKSLRKFAKEYAEFESLLRILGKLTLNDNADMTEQEQELLDEIEEISKPHLKAVVMSDHALIDAYNQLVELYDQYSDKKASLKEVDRVLYELERSFCDVAKEFSKKPQEIQEISKNPIFASIYNDLIGLFNHYSRKQQLKKALDSL